MPSSARVSEGGGRVIAGTRKVVPAAETTEGMLCLEVRVRLYRDGAMSKLLEKLAKVSVGACTVH